MKEGNVKITSKRYEELISLETRVNIVVDKIGRDEYLRTEDILSILGTEFALELADEIIKKREERLKQYEKEKSSELEIVS